ncbi:hypothetical protein KAX02_03070, partial [candidate division WOR-3 bacterium]|nr:hypothetical protein [candidate division WOR-3 bacterium]
MINKYFKIMALWVALVFVTAFPVSAFDFHTGVAGGSDTEVLFNDSGQVAGDAGMTYDKATDTLILSGNVGIGTASPSQELDLIGDLELEMTTSADTGVIYKGADKFIHNFQHPTGDTAVPVGENIFIGVNAGNFTMGSTATEAYQGSYNSAIGYN